MFAANNRFGSGNNRLRAANDNLLTENDRLRSIHDLVRQENDRLRREADCGGCGNKGFFGGEDRVVDGLNGRRNRSTCFALVNDQ